MDRNRVFIGFNKSGKRCLLYLNDDNNSFKDLETKETYSFSDIQPKSLINYNELYDVKVPLKFNFVHTFQKFEDEEMELQNLYIGNVARVRKIVKDSVYRGTIEQQFYRTTLLFNVLLKKEDDYGRYTYSNVINNDLYKFRGVGYKVGDFYIDEEELTPFALEFYIPKSQLPKRKVLEIYNSKYGIGGKK